MKKTKESYKEIFEVLKKHKDICCFDITDLENQSKIHLFWLELKEKHGFDISINLIRSTNWNNIGEYMSIGWWGEKHNRTISRLDDGEQPEDELLLKIGFSTGPLIFGRDYPSDFFKLFFRELKAYNPKYLDSANKDLYFSMDNASNIFNDFKFIMGKYHKLNKEDVKQRNIIKMEKDLQKLKET
jgi:hypothetical protein